MELMILWIQDLRKMKSNRGYTAKDTKGRMTPGKNPRTVYQALIDFHQTNPRKPKDKRVPNTTQVVVHHQ